MTTLLVGVLIGWLAGSLIANSANHDAFHRGYAAGRTVRTAFRSIEEIQAERDAVEADRLIQETR
jgi:hypothetical protein